MISHRNKFKLQNIFRRCSEGIYSNFTTTVTQRCLPASNILLIHSVSTELLFPPLDKVLPSTLKRDVHSLTPTHPPEATRSSLFKATTADHRPCPTHSRAASLSLPPLCFVQQSLTFSSPFHPLTYSCINKHMYI